MIHSKPISTEEEYNAAMKRIDELIALYPFENKADEDELERISDLVFAYEDIYYPVEASDSSE